MLFAVVSPMHISVPIRAGTLICVWVTKSIHIAPQSENGTAISTISGIGQALEIDHQKQKDQHDRQRHAGIKPAKALPHRLDLAAQLHLDRLRRVGLIGLDHLLDGVGGRIQIAPLHIGMNVENRPDIELR